MIVVDVGGWKIHETQEKWNENFSMDTKAHVRIAVVPHLPEIFCDRRPRKMENDLTDRKIPDSRVGQNTIFIYCPISGNSSTISISLRSSQ